jgi:GDP-fucose transporter C1
MVEVEGVAQEVRKKTIQAALAVTFYMSVSLALVFLNRFILTDSLEKAGALFVSWYQFVVAYVCILIITIFFPNVPFLNLFHPIRYKLSVAVQVLPVSVAYLMMIGFNNKCLEYVSVSGYQIARSLTILFSIILSFVFQGQRTSLRACGACLGVVVGFLCGVQGDVDLSLKGGFYGVCSSCFLATYTIVVKKVMGLLNNDEFLLIEYNTPIAVIVLAPFVWVSGEFDILKEPHTRRFWIVQTVTGVVGFVINIAIFLNIKFTTPLTHNLSGTLKACLQTLLAFVFFPKGETMTPLKALGTALVIGFSAYYAFVRKAEMKAKIEAENQQETQPLIEEKQGIPLLDPVKSDSSGQDLQHQKSEKRTV